MMAKVQQQGQHEEGIMSYTSLFKKVTLHGIDCADSWLNTISMYLQDVQYLEINNDKSRHWLKSIMESEEANPHDDFRIDLTTLNSLQETHISLDAIIKSMHSSPRIIKIVYVNGKREQNYRVAVSINTCDVECNLYCYSHISTTSVFISECKEKNSYGTPITTIKCAGELKIFFTHCHNVIAELHGGRLPNNSPDPSFE